MKKVSRLEDLMSPEGRRDTSRPGQYEAPTITVLDEAQLLEFAKEGPEFAFPCFLGLGVRLVADVVSDVVFAVSLGLGGVHLFGVDLDQMPLGEVSSCLVTADEE